MRILFIDLPTTLTFNVATPDDRPLGGMASGECYLARALAARGHDVTLVAKLPEGTPDVLMGVRHVAQEGVLRRPSGFFSDGDYDAVIAINYPDIAPAVKRASPRTFNVIWLHIYPDQPALKSLDTVQGTLDAAVCVSETLREAFKISTPKVAIGNAISPFFENMFASADEVLKAKRNRAVYASMPFRGLDQLVEVMGQAKGEVELDVYSSADTYQDGKDYAAIFDAARRNPRIRTHGGVSQRKLAEAFRGAAYLTYPSTYIESSCIVAMEAMAAGLKVISNDIGALPETTMGFADLVPAKGGTIYRHEHVAGITKFLEKNETEFRRDPKAWAEKRFTELQVVNREYNWARRAEQWEAFLAPAVAARREGARTAAQPQSTESKGAGADSGSTSQGLQEAIAMHRIGNLAGAAAKCAEVVRLEPGNAMAHYFFGVLLLQQGKHTEAVESFDRDIALNPDHSEAYNNRGIALCSLARIEQGVASFDNALRKNPNAADVLNNRAMALLYLKRPEDALAGFDAALAIQPTYVQALMARGSVLHTLGRREEALASYDKAVALRPSPELHHNRAMVLADLSRFDDAIAGFDQALVLKPDLAEARTARENLRQRHKRH